MSSDTSISTSSSWSWKTVAAVGAGALIAGTAAYFILSKTPITVKKQRKQKIAQQPTLDDIDTREQIKNLLEMLNSGASKNQKHAVEEFHKLSKYKETHDILRESGVLEGIITLLKQTQLDETMVFRLTRIIANLSTNERNRIIIGESVMEQLIKYLEISNESIKENILRGFMNLTIATVNEDILREKGGLKLLMQLFKSDSTSQELMYHTGRVLVNLAFENVTNRKGIIAEGGVERLLELLHKTPQKERIFLRLIRLYGFLVVDCDVKTYSQLATRENGIFFVKLLLQNVESSDISFSSVAFLSIKKVTKERDVHASQFNEIVKEFQSAFAEEVDGTNGVNLISAFLLVSEPALQTLALEVLSGLARDNDEVQEAIKGNIKGWTTIRELASPTNDEPVCKAATSLISDLSMVEALD